MTARKGRFARAVVLGLTVLMVGAQSPAGAAPRSQSADVGARWLDDQPEDASIFTSEDRHAPGRISGAPDQVLSRAWTPSDPMTMVTAARELLHGAWGPDLPTDTASLAESAQASSSTDTVYRVSSPIGDLDGDGLDDLLTVEIDLLSYSARLIGTRGTDGADMWIVDASDFAAFPLPVGDLDGDGADDLLVLRLQFEGLGIGNCAVVACVFGLNYDYVWSVEARSGKDGSLRWHRDYEGEITEGFMFAGGIAAVAIADAFTATNLFVIPSLGGDLDGDGHPDVVVNALDVTGFFGVGFAGFLAYGFTYANHYLVATDAVVVSGLDGEESFDVSQDYMPGGSMLVAVGDLVGSSAPDLLWTTTSDTRIPETCVYGLVAYACAEHAESEVEAQLIEGGSFEISWTKSFSGAQIRLWPAGGDLDGDGRPDLQGESYSTIGTCAYALLVSTCGYELLDLFISGHSGQDLWEREAEWSESYPAVIGDVGGTPGNDVVYFRGEWEPASLAVVATRLDGATGFPILVTRSSHPDSQAGWTSVSVFLSPDTDGDGVFDLVFASAYYDYDQRAITRSTATIESGKTGLDLYTTSFDGYETYVRGGDLDGDGLADLVGVQHEVSLGRLHTSLRAIHPGPGTVSWLRSGSVPFKAGTDWLWISIRPAGNLSRVDGGDLISSIHMEHFDHDAQTWVLRWQVEAVNGSDGSPLWSHGSL